LPGDCRICLLLTDIFAQRANRGSAVYVIRQWERVGQRLANLNRGEQMFMQPKPQYLAVTRALALNHSRAGTRALTANHSRAVTRALSQNHSRTVTRALTSNHSRAVTRSLTLNHSRAVTRSLAANHSRAVAAAGQA
jgi:hypothetical protein